jgi:hypothetical protein
MRRRQVLATGAAFLSLPLAGCVHPEVILTMDSATADDIADRVSLHPDPDAEEYTVTADAVENGSTTRRGRYELFDRTSTVRLNNSFYELTETRLSGSEVTVYEVLLDVNPENTTAELGAIAYEELPETDRRRLDGILSEKPPETDGYDVGVSYGSAAEVGDESVFVPERQYDILVYEGDRYRVAVDSRTAPEAEYRYTATEVAPTVEAFADQVREEYLFTLSGLSDAEREVVEEAIEGGYYEDSDAFQSVLDRIRSHEGIEIDDFYGTWLLEYESEEYITYVEW